MKIKGLRRISRPCRSNREILLYAVLTAVAVQAVFWCAFSYRRPAPAAKVRGSSVSLLSRSGFNAQELAAFRQWLDNHDPSRFSRSDFSGGFAAQLPVEPYRGDIADRRPHVSGQIGKPLVEGFRKLPEPEAPPKVVLRIPATSRLSGNGSGKVMSMPHVYDESGREIALGGVVLPSRTAGVQGHTVLRVLGSGRTVTLVVDSSCGDPKLDRFAQGVLSAVVAGLETPPLYITVRWPDNPVGKEAGK